MPIPVSLTSRKAYLSLTSVLIVTRPPGWLYLIALSSNTRTACSNNVGSPITNAASFDSNCKLIPDWSANAWTRLTPARAISVRCITSCSRCEELLSRRASVSMLVARVDIRSVSVTISSNNSASSDSKCSRLRSRTSASARSRVSGVRSSWAASPMKRCWFLQASRAGSSARFARNSPPNPAPSSVNPPMLSKSIRIKDKASSCGWIDSPTSTTPTYPLPTGFGTTCA